MGSKCIQILSLGRSVIIGLGLAGVDSNRTKSISCDDGAQYDGHLNHCILKADAAPRACSKRKVVEAKPRLVRLPAKRLGKKSSGLLQRIGSR